MNIIDVTLRDGGHAVDFDWPISFARNYYNVLTDLPEVTTIELGYWGQTSKSENTFYNLNYDKVCNITRSQSKKNISVMIDYHYCSHNVDDYPTDKQNEISMIRMCSRKEDILNALEFGKKLKEHTNLNISFNIFNATNYTEDEIRNLSNVVTNYPFDYIYFADTHGDLDLTKDFNRFKIGFDIFKSSGKKVGFHLHDHSGMGMVNYRELIRQGVESTDTSVRGMGKGSGNLKLEYVVDKKHITPLAQLILDNEKLLTITPSPYELITSAYGVTDNYAKYGAENNMNMKQFNKFCASLHGKQKDNYDILKRSLV